MFGRCLISALQFFLVVFQQLLLYVIWKQGIKMKGFLNSHHKYYQYYQSTKNKDTISRVADPDPNWIRIQSGQWIRIRNPGPGGQK